MALFPNIPNAPGVPPIRRNPLATVANVLILGADLLILFGFNSVRWGIYRHGRNVVTADTVVSVDYKQDWTISDYQQEQGAFQSYNKVQSPFDGRVRFASGGDLENRQALLNSIAAIAGTTNLYDIVTPEKTYRNVNVIHYDYRRRSDHGLGLMTIDVWLMEVRVDVQTAFVNTKTPAGADPVNGGTVQSKPAVPKQSALKSLVQ